MKLAFSLVALAVLAGAQTTSSHSGWSFTDTLQTATDVVVADIVSGSGVDDGSQVTVRATVKVARVLSGGYAPSAEIPLTWTYRPTLIQGPASTTKVAAERGLWFLRREGGGRVTPLQAGIMMMSDGGYYLPAGAAPRYYAADAPLATKIACEIAPLIEEIATQRAADLAPRAYQPSNPPSMPAWAQTRNRFQGLVMTLQNLDGKAKREIYADFSARPEPYLKAIGIAGRLESDDPSALIELEKNVAVLAPIYASGVVMLHSSLSLQNHLPAARALARLAIGETALPAVEGNAAFQLASTRSLEFLPYFIVMLGNPAPWTRDAVLMQFCTLLREGAFWKPEMAEHCPNRSPLNDAAREQAEIRYWTSWWEANRDRIAKTTPLASVNPPARYSIPQPGAGVMVEMPPESRFLGFLHMTQPPADHTHAADGTITLGITRWTDPLLQQLPESDRPVWTELAAAVNAKLKANDDRGQQVMNAARIAGKMPELAQMKALNDERNAILKAGLDQLRNRLSPAGWQAVEKRLNETGGAMIRIVAPPPK